MKISRNTLCPCGSGKKYKNCHINALDKKKSSKMNQLAELNEFTKRAKIKKCIHPNSEECSSKIIKAHSIQNGRVLKKLAKNGHVIMPQNVSGKVGQKLLKVELSKIGKNIASTFNGFCSYHDNILFEHIDDMNFKYDEIQIFLYSYRAFAREYIVKQEALKMQRLFFADYPQKAIKIGFIESSINPHQLSVNGNEKDLQQFNEALLKNDFSVLKHIIFELDYEVNFSTSFATEIEKDLDNKMMNNIFEISEDYKPSKAFINVIPDEGKSYIIIACLENEYHVYQKYFEQIRLLHMQDNNRCFAYLTNLIVRNSENIVIGSKLWDFFVAENLVTQFNRDWYESLEELMSPYLTSLNFNKDLTISRGYNLFINL